MNGRTSYSEQTKATAIAALLTGDTPSWVAREYGVPLNTVKSWRRRLKRGEIGPFAPQKKDLGGPLLDHLETLLRSLIVQGEHLADPELLGGMRASEIALFHGILFDRTMRTLELAGPMLRAREEGRDAS